MVTVQAAMEAGVVLLPLLALIAVATAQFEIDVKLVTDNAIEGGNLLIVCDVKWHTPTMKPYTLVWVKKIDHEETEIGYQSDVAAPFKNTKRYNASYTLTRPHDFSRIKFTLSITNLQTSDSGEIGCKIPNNNIEIFKTFHVLAPVQSVRLASRDIHDNHAMVYINGQHIQFNEGEIRQLFCHANGSSPAPRLKMFRGDEDITNLFKASTEQVKKGIHSTLTHIFYKGDLVNKSLHIGYEFTDKWLRCTAEVPGSNFTVVSTAINVTLAGYRPKFDCSHLVLATMYENRVQLACTVRAQPPVKSALFRWKRHTFGNVTLATGNQDGSYTATLKNGKILGEKLMVLTINQIFTQHFREYYLEAENSQGMSEYTILLEKDLKRHSRSGANENALSVCLTVLSIWLTSIL